MARVLFVAVEPPWPPNQGGRVRMAGLVEGLAERHDITVATWGSGPQDDGGHDMIVLPPAAPKSKFAGFASRKPRLVHQLVGKDGYAALQRVARDRDFDFAVYSHSYLAAALPIHSVRAVVDMANVESERLRGFARSGGVVNRTSAYLESIKAARWEPKAVRDADLVTVLSEPDLRWVEKHTDSALLVPNGVSAPPELNHSPADGYALYVASVDYEPNRLGARLLIDEVWPMVRTYLPNAELRIAGRGSREALGAEPAPGVQVVGAVDSLDPVYREAGLVLAPVTQGAGRQLKVVEALAHGRAVVATAYSHQSVPAPLRELVPPATTAAEFASTTADLLRDAQARWDVEAHLIGSPDGLNSWAEVVRPLSDWMSTK